MKLERSDAKLNHFKVGCSINLTREKIWTKKKFKNELTEEKK